MVLTICLNLTKQQHISLVEGLLLKKDPEITVKDNLDLGQHILEFSSMTMGFLRYNVALAPRQTREVAFKTLVRIQLDYAAPIWHPYNKTQ